jgi:predicted unusual protein kinase regulating ubiquinone biosynthesis (AarF/ABC1/UbiB family)
MPSVTILYEVAYNQPFRFPATFTFVMRAFSTLEGVGKGLDPTFNFMEVAKPFAMEIMNNGAQSTANGLFNELGRQAVEVSNRAFNLPRRVEETLDKLEQGDIRIRTRSIETERLLRRVSSAQLGTNYAILMGSFLLSASILWVNGQVGLAIPLLILSTNRGGIFLRLMIRLDQSDR